MHWRYTSTPSNRHRIPTASMRGQTLARRSSNVRDAPAAIHRPCIPTTIDAREGLSTPNDGHSTDIMPLSVGTDPGLALKTRKGTGYYKVPALKGVWYRGRYLHDGTVASLKEMFDPERLSKTHVPGGWKPTGSKTYAIVGHEFGMKLPGAERRDLIAFLRTL